MGEGTTGDRAQVAMRAELGWLPTTHLLLCGPIPNKLIGHGLGVGDPGSRGCSGRCTETGSPGG